MARLKRLRKKSKTGLILRSPPQRTTRISYALSGHGFTGCGKKQSRRHSEERSDEESLFLLGKKARGIPHSVRNDAEAAFFRSLFNRAVSAAEPFAPAQYYPISVLKYYRRDMASMLLSQGVRTQAGSGLMNQPGEMDDRADNAKRTRYTHARPKSRFAEPLHNTGFSSALCALSVSAVRLFLSSLQPRAPSLQNPNRYATKIRIPRDSNKTNDGDHF
jgi:hypothetical protein